MKKKFEEYARTEMSEEILRSPEYRNNSVYYAEKLKKALAGEIVAINARVGERGPQHC